MSIVTVYIKNQTPPDWEARITGAVATFNHRGGGNSEDSNPNINLPSGNGEITLHSANVDCVTGFRLVLAVRDRQNRVTLVDRSFRDPAGRECCEDQDVTLGQSALLKETLKKLNMSDDEKSYNIDNFSK